MNKKKGFTLIELLVVIAIIGILASVVLASLNSARKKSRDSRRIADINQLKIALEMFADANSAEYPDALSSLVPTYMPSEPKDPSSQASYVYDNLTSTGAACAIATGDCLLYHLGANLEEGTNSVLDSDVDACVSGCTRTLAGTTLDGTDGGGATANHCLATDTGTSYYCYDVTP